MNTNQPYPPSPPERPAISPRVHILLVSAVIAVALLATAGVVASVVMKPKAAKPTATSSSPSATPAPTATPLALSVGAQPSFPAQLPAGYTARIFANQLGIARDLVMSPGGTLLVSDPRANTVTALPDANHDGVADRLVAVVKEGKQVHGLAFHGKQLFVAQLDRVVRYNWDEASLTASLDKTILTLPSVDGHTSRTLSINAAGQVFVTIGSTCNACREPNAQHATVLVSDINGTNPRTFATGLRNAAFSAINPRTNELWATENGRDLLGDNLPPDEVNVVREGKNYGWPVCYGMRVHDTNFDKAKYIADPCASTEPPLYQVPAHNAPLGLSFIKSNQFPAAQQGDLLVALHGSWNRSVPDGYKVVRLHVVGDTIVSSEDFMTGFIQGKDVVGRPVDVTFDANGNLYVSDDKAGAVYIIQHQPQS